MYMRLRPQLLFSVAWIGFVAAMKGYCWYRLLELFGQLVTFSGL